MDDSTKKPIMIGIVLVCLVVAGFLFTKMRSGISGTEGMGAGEKVWIKCDSQDCDAEYQMSKKAYYENWQAVFDRTGSPLTCQECGEETVDKALKCPSCDVVFYKGTSEKGFADACPECNFSPTEEAINQELREEE